MEPFVIDGRDSVFVDLETGRKYARRFIAKGEAVIKYGCPIGVALADIEKNAFVHTHNLGTALAGAGGYEYEPKPCALAPAEAPTVFAYERADGRIGVRNDVWIVPTVGCVNAAGEAIAKETGAFCFSHPCGCSQLGDDLKRTQLLLRGLILHPNAGGVLVLGLGCENNRIEDLRALLGPFDPGRIRFLKAQDAADEVEAGIRTVRELQGLSALDRRTPVSAARLVLGLKCGGSDGYSGITANPLVGRVTDRLLASGGAAVMTEVPEMFGAEADLLSRCTDRAVFDRAAGMLSGYRRYFLDRGEGLGENPSPGNREGGITTLEEKSLGCVRKGGSGPVADVLDYGDFVRKPGLSLLTGPGNDMIAVTNLTAAGCHMILFTTGRGTPLGGPIPTLKIASNTALWNRKRRWLDFNAEGGSAEALWRLTLETASGKPAANEQNGARAVALYRDGVTL